jgi:hypothetical protein
VVWTNKKGMRKKGGPKRDHSVRVRDFDFVSRTRMSPPSHDGVEAEVSQIVYDVQDCVDDLDDHASYRDAQDFGVFLQFEIFKKKKILDKKASKKIFLEMRRKSSKNESEISERDPSGLIKKNAF